MEMALVLCVIETIPVRIVVRDQDSDPISSCVPP